MSVTEEMRKVFDACTVMAGVEPDFECVYMTKGVALLYLDEIDAENAKLRELIRELFRDFANADYELKSRCGRTFMAVTRYLPRLQELEVEP